MSGVHYHLHASSVSGCVLCTLMNSTITVQHKELPNEDLTELEAQGKDEDKRNK